jgi:hypothetical protein
MLRDLPTYSPEHRPPLDEARDVLDAMVQRVRDVLVPLAGGQLGLLLPAQLHDDGIPGVTSLDQHRTRVVCAGFRIVTGGRPEAVR